MNLAFFDGVMLIFDIHFKAELGGRSVVILGSRFRRAKFDTLE